MQISIMDSDYEVMKKLELLINDYPRMNVKCFTTTKQLVEAAKNKLPDIVILDIDSQNGSSVVKNIQSISTKIKIIIMSKEKEKVADYFKLNVDGFLIKPVDKEKLKEQLLRVKYPLIAKTKYGYNR